MYLRNQNTIYSQSFKHWHYFTILLLFSYSYFLPLYFLHYTTCYIILYNIDTILNNII